LGGRSLIDCFEADSGDESGHDQYALRDALALGVAQAELRNTPPSTAVRQYLSILGEVVRSVTPLGVTGAAWILTKIAFGGAWSLQGMADNLVARSGIPHIAHAVSVWVLHGELDQHHIEEQTAEILCTPLQYGDAEAIVRIAADIGRIWPTIAADLPLTGFAEHLRAVR
jgi:pyrroloquinoline quinone (PQQ) biosynthesis protein C